MFPKLIFTDAVKQRLQDIKFILNEESKHDWLLEQRLTPAVLNIVAKKT